ncbi:MAG: DUF3461 family protein [Woeseiaceae bacterium]|jgi:hypothetical protein
MTKNRLFPTLYELGITNPMQIDDYYVTMINHVEVLRIVYDRPKDSFLTSSKTYKFPRIHADAGTPVAGGATETVLRTHPKLVAALEELDELMKMKSRKENIAARILGEIALLEEDIAMRTECLRTLAGKIRTVE